MAKTYHLRLAELTAEDFSFSPQSPPMVLIGTTFYNFDLLKALKNRNSAANIANLMARNTENEARFWSMPLTRTASWIGNPKNIGEQLSTMQKNLQANGLTDDYSASLTWDDFVSATQSWHLLPHSKGKEPSLKCLTLEGLYQDFFYLHGRPRKNGVTERGFFLVNGEQGQQDNFVPIYSVEDSNGVATRTEYLDKAGLTERQNFTRQEARQRYNLFEHSIAVKPTAQNKVPPPPLVKATTPEPPVPKHLQHVPPKMRSFVADWVAKAMAHDPK